jgi:small subunit ribosomal protein S20
MATEKAKTQVKAPTALKRALQDKKRALQNKSFKSMVKTALRSFHEAITNKETDGLTEKLNAIFSLMDKGVKKHIFKSNKAARIKSTMQKKVSALKS